MTLLKKAVYRSWCTLAAALIGGGVSLSRAHDQEGLDGTRQPVSFCGVNGA